MEDKTLTIRIDSILGGHSPTTHFSRADQFRASIGIDPSQPITDTTLAYSIVSSGLLRPNGIRKLTDSILTNAPMWMESNPKDGNVYVYDYAGSVYTIGSNFDTFTALSDAGEMTGAHGNGCAYYDNYIYFAKDTTVARYGPLNGTPLFNGDYWVTTLSKTRLTENANYPSDSRTSIKYPTHVMHRHSDGKLYIADVVDNKGTIHYIATTKSSVEGDTDNGSTYNKVQVGYGLIPTCMESYGNELVVAFYEGTNAFLSQSRAKVAFWDTTSQNVNKITWVEFPDPYISSMKNIDGVLYVASGRVNSDGFRVTRFVGGYTFEEVDFYGTGSMPFPDAMDGQSNQLLFGSFTDVPVTSGCVYSRGLNNSSLGMGRFVIAGASYSSAVSNVTSLHLSDNWNMGFLAPTVGWSTGASGGDVNGIDKKATTYGLINQIWWSQTYRIGQPFKIKKIRIPLAQILTSTMSIVPKIYTNSNGGSTILDTINSTNFGNALSVVIKPENLTADNCFWLELKWTGTTLCVVELPIIIEYELLDINSNYS